MSDIKRTSARAVARDYGIRHGLHREVAQELESILESYAEQETATLRKRLAEAERRLTFERRLSERAQITPTCPICKSHENVVATRWECAGCDDVLDGRRSPAPGVSDE